MRQDKLKLPPPSGPDRPSDPWMDDCIDGSSPRVRTWSGLRRRALLIMTTLTLLVVVLLWMALPASVIFKPGELSTPHAQILAGTLTQDRCGACHVESSLSPMAWLRASFRSTDEAHQELNSSELCMNCHKQVIPAQYATSAHNLPLSHRDRLTRSIKLAAQKTGRQGELDQLALQRFFPSAVVDQNEIQCSVCHQEHHGRKGDLLVMSDAQCQSCHAERFGAFADSHPGWQSWPYGRGGQIAFDHGSHHDKHFPSMSGSTPSGGTKFDCNACHPLAGTGSANSIAAFSAATGAGSKLPVSGEVTRTVSYELACASCHDKALQQQSASGLDLLALPMIPDAVARELASSSEWTWPMGAIGYPDGLISPLTELLLRSDPDVSAIVRQVPGGDLSRLSPNDPKTKVIVRGLAVEYRRLVSDLSREGHIAFSRRLSRLGIPDQAISSVLRTLPPQLLESANEKWFGASQSSASFERTDSLSMFVVKDENATPKRSREVADSRITLVETSPTIRQVAADDRDSLLLDDDLLTEDPLADELLAEDPLTDDPLANDPLASDSLTTPTPVPADQQLKFGGWRRDDLRLAIHYRASGHTDPVLVGLIETFAHLKEGDPLRKRFFKQSVVAACVECHATADSIIPQWTSIDLVGRKSEFTKFSHRPHLNVSGLGSCLHCHQVTPETSSMTNDFQPLTRESCAACHLPHAAGDSCTTCHRYHIHPTLR